MLLFKFVHNVYQYECHTYEKGWYQTKPLIKCFQPGDNRYDPKPKKLIHGQRHVRFELLCVSKRHVHYRGVLSWAPINENVHAGLLELVSETGYHGLDDFVV